MKRKNMTLFISFAFFSTVITTAFPQVGDHTNRKTGIMDGNLINTTFDNDGEIGRWLSAPSGEWPKGSGHNYLDGITFFAAAETVDANGDTIHPVETNYREGMDVSPDGITWGFEPLPDYDNPSQNSPAKSDNPETWPTHWPDRPDSWDGFWNGYFGKGVMNADLETYFVVDDDPDEEWNFFPDSTDLTRRGLGLQVAIRGWQWADESLKNVMVWHYEITNEGTTDYEKVVCGIYTDNGIGGFGDSGDDNGAFDQTSQMVYAWDNDGISWEGWSPTGYVGYIFLETPGNALDGIDNDGDGLIDESRDNGIDDDGDWNPETDDVGADGVADTGDQGEGDGKPTDGEPNFDRLDPGESDQIGLTSVAIRHAHDLDLYNDEKIWNAMRPGNFDGQCGPCNLIFYLGSGYFPLPAGKSQRFSLAVIFGSTFDELIARANSVRTLLDESYRIVNHVVEISYGSKIVPKVRG